MWDVSSDRKPLLDGILARGGVDSASWQATVALAPVITGGSSAGPTADIKGMTYIGQPSGRSCWSTNVLLSMAGDRIHL